MPGPTAPTTELGSPSRNNASGFGGAAIYSEAERNRDMQWPRNVQVTYPAMLNDAQIEGLFRGMTWSIRAFDWWLEPNGARPATVRRVSADYNLPVGRGTRFDRRRGQQRFSFENHLEDALRAVVLGHYAFEQVYEIVQDGAENVNGGWLAHLRKLAPRPPATMTEIKVAPDGGLEFIKVPALKPDDRRIRAQREVEIPVDRLVFYAWDKEAANWRGRSMLRSLYRPWKLKDSIMRVGAINIQRAGGVPYANAPQGANPQDASAILEALKDFKVSEEGAAVFPYGTELKFAAAGGGEAAVEYVKLQNEEMARAWLLMFMQLGQTQSGSRALAEPLIDYVQLGQTVIGNWFAGIFNEHVIEDDVELNEGAGEEYAPLLKCAPAGDPLDAIQGALDDAASAGALPDGSEVLAMVRGARAGARGRSRRQPFRSSAATTRELSPAASFVDWGGIDETVTAARDGLVEAWRSVRSAQIEEIRSLVEQADGDLTALAALRVPTRGRELLAQAMADVADFGVRSATDEAAAQGVTLPDPWDLVEPDPAGVQAGVGDWLRRPLSRLRRLIEERSGAIAETLAGSVSETAAREAVRQTGDAVTPAEVAEEVVQHLDTLSDAFLDEQLGGAITQGFNGGRRETMRGAPDGSRVEASSLLDSNVCTPCSHADGHVYASLEEAEQQFPTGGNKSCEGRGRCRCTLVLVAPEEAPATVAAVRP